MESFLLNPFALALRWGINLVPVLVDVAWDALVPLTWVVSLGKAMTLDQLQRRGWSLTNRCFMCQAHEESIDYILLHCSKAWELWELLFFLFGDYWVIPSFIRDILLGWYDSFVRRKWKKVWGVVPFAWTIWTERNRRSFQNEELFV